MNDMSRMSFLGPGLNALSAATATVVGAGGGGSHIAQQLAHAGFGLVIVLDADSLEDSNVTRVVCVNYRDVGRTKATLIASRLHHLAGTVRGIVCRGESSRGKAWIEHSDIVFGAMDGARARENIEKICRAALVPYIDIGLTIDVADAGKIRAIGGQVVVSIAGGPCLRCAGVVTDESLARDRQEYGAKHIAQQLVSMNGILASQAVTAGIALVANYAPTFPPPAVARYDGLLHEIKSDRYLPDTCIHFRLQDIGWRIVLPPRKSGADEHS